MDHQASSPQKQPYYIEVLALVVPYIPTEKVVLGTLQTWVRNVTEFYYIGTYLYIFSTCNVYILAKLVPLLLGGMTGPQEKIETCIFIHYSINFIILSTSSSVRVLNLKRRLISIFALRNSKKILNSEWKCEFIFFELPLLTTSTAVAIGKANIINGLLPQNSLPTTYLLGLKLLPRFAKVASKVQELAPRANILLGTYYNNYTTHLGS